MKAEHLSKIRHHAEKIEYYYKYAGSRGYAQAVYHIEELIYLLFRARASEKYKEEETLINGIRLEMEQKMAEMKERAEVSSNK